MPYVLGQLQISKVYELSFTLPMTLAFPEIGPTELRALREWYRSEELTEDPATAQVRMSCHSYVLQVGGRNILIDACNGNDKPREHMPFADRLQTAYLQNLAATGLSPDDIDLVLCTHLHGDHIGWNTRLAGGRWVPTFRNARYLFSRENYEFLGRQADDPLHGPAYRDSVLPVIEHGVAELVDTRHVVEHEIGNGVWLGDAPGHTPGNCMVYAQRGGTLALFSGDTFHHPVELICPQTACFADYDTVLAATTRRRLFEQYADSDTTFFPAHFERSSGGRIVRRRDHYAFEFLAGS